MDMFSSLKYYLNRRLAIPDIRTSIVDKYTTRISSRRSPSQILVTTQLSFIKLQSRRHEMRTGRP